MTKQELNYPEIRAPVEQVRCECVAQAVRRQLLAYARLVGITLDNVPESLPRHAIAAAGREQVVGLALEQDLHARAFDEVLQPALGFLAERYQALAVALADDTTDAVTVSAPARGEVYNVATGSTCTIRELAEAARKDGADPEVAEAFRKARAAGS